MRGILLTVDRGDLMSFTKSDQSRQCDLGAIGHQAEHGFAKYRPSQADAVKPAAKPSIYPCLHTVCQASDMQSLVSMNHVGNDPSTVLAGSRCIGAVLDNFIKSRVDPNLRFVELLPLA